MIKFLKNKIIKWIINNLKASIKNEVKDKIKDSIKNEIKASIKDEVKDEISSNLKKIFGNDNGDIEYYECWANIKYNSQFKRVMINIIDEHAKELVENTKLIKDYIDNEKLIDDVVNRINRKQVK